MCPAVDLAGSLACHDNEAEPALLRIGWQRVLRERTCRKFNQDLRLGFGAGDGKPGTLGAGTGHSLSAWSERYCCSKTES